MNEEKKALSTLLYAYMFMPFVGVCVCVQRFGQYGDCYVLPTHGPLPNVPHVYVTSQCSTENGGLQASKAMSPSLPHPLVLHAVQLKWSRFFHVTVVDAAIFRQVSAIQHYMKASPAKTA